jgi:hypothetical protein
MSSYISDFLTRLRGSSADASKGEEGAGEGDWAVKDASTESIPWIRISGTTTKGPPQVRVFSLSVP